MLRFNAFVTGPPGSGKRLIARALHEHSSRRSSPFVPVDCARLTSSLFRSELFGKVYEETTTLGCLRAANGGTIYLGNIDRLTHTAQLELLQVLESKAVVPSGSQQSYEIDVRLVAGSVRDLEEQVRQGRMRAELFRRLCVIGFETTPLRTRPSDVIPIANFLMAKMTFEQGVIQKHLTPAASEILTRHTWPGNVRELRDVLDQAISGNDKPFVASTDLCIHAREIEADNLRWKTLADLEGQHIRETLLHTQGDIEQAALLLGIARAELDAKVGNLFI